MGNHQKNPYSKFSSKVARINIELPRYEFFHSPSKANNLDSRFIGREKLVSKFKNILENGKTKTGAYLVTGYRGMGKSSFVSVVLDAITKRPKFKWGALSMCICFFFIFYLLGRSEAVFDLLPLFMKNLSAQILTSYFWLSSICYVRRRQIVSAIQEFSVVHYIFLIKLACALMMFIQSLNHTAHWAIIFLGLLINSLSFFRLSLKIRFKNIKEIGKYIWDELKKIRLPYKKYLLDHRSRIVINLNLGNDIYEELDILSLIAINIRKKFHSYAYSLRRQWFFYSVRGGGVLIISCFVANLSNEQFSSIQDSLLFSSYFPSQDTIVQTQSDKQTILSLRDSKIGVHIEKKAPINETVLFDYCCMLDTVDQQLILRKHRSKFSLGYAIFIADLYADALYFHFRAFLSDYILFGWNLLPRHINYLFIFFFIIVYVFLVSVIRLLTSLPNVGYTTRGQILKKLDSLNEQISSILHEEKGVNATVSKKVFSVPLQFGFSRKKSLQYPLAGVRQIEKCLIDILEDIEHLIPPYIRPQFIIVFDELDKISPKKHTAKTEQGDYFHEKTSDGEMTRARKESVLGLLSNMKYFITTAQAKFIFITGRELFDAFLADVSDREFSISSIFHEVFYIDSFLSDGSDNNRKDITSMPEHYVCSFLMPKEYILEEVQTSGKPYLENLTLKVYYSYLKKHVTTDEAVLQKTVLILYQFVTYLTHVSNGAPKKITNFFEKYICTSEEYQIHTKHINSEIPPVDIIRKGEEFNFYLSFGYSEQAKIGFIFYLANPLILAIVNNVINYGDKLLVSTSFLIDHIFKFHKNGFSARNLAVAPEMLDINRSTELRKLIESIMVYFKQTHIRPIISGLYTFKYPQKISEEVSFISKLSEEAAAIFNFTLDESLSVKRHYSKMLENYKLRHVANCSLENNGQPQSLAEIYHILGDLKLLDEDYTEAIIEYKDCVANIPQDFTSIDSKNVAYNLLMLIRTMLKMGLAFEKRKTHNSALAVYSELVSILIDFKSVKGKSEIYNQSKKNERLLLELALNTDPLSNKIISRLSLFDDERLMYQALLAKLFVLEKNQLEGITYTNLKITEGEFEALYSASAVSEKYLVAVDFYKKLGDIIFYKNSLIVKKCNSLFGCMELWGHDIYDEIDDTYNGNRELLLGIKDSNSFKDLDYKWESKQLKYLEISVNEYLENQECSNLEDEKKAIIEFIKNKWKPSSMTENGMRKAIIQCKEKRAKCLKKRTSLPCYACRYYTKSLKLLVRNLLQIVPYESKISKSFLFLEALEKKEKFDAQWKSQFPTVASALDGFGDVLLSCVDENDKLWVHTLDFFSRFIRSHKYEVLEKNMLLRNVIWYARETTYEGKTKEKHDSYIINCERKYIKHINETRKEKQAYQSLTQLEKVLFYYYTAARYYESCSQMKNAHGCYQKIIQLFLEYSKHSDLGKEEKKFVLEIAETLLQKAVKCMYSAYDLQHLAETQKIKWNFSKEMYENLDKSQLSVLADLEETFYAFIELSLTLNKESGALAELYSSSVFSSLRLNNSVYNHVLSLNLKAKMNRQVLNRIFDGTDIWPASKECIEDFISKVKKKKFKKILKIKENKDDDGFRELEHVIVDSIFCLVKFIEIISPQTKTTLFTNSYIAGVYKELLGWTSLFELLFLIYAFYDKTYPKENNGSKKDDINKYLKTFGIGDLEEDVQNSQQFDDKAENFFDMLCFQIEKNKTHYINRVYIKEMALEYYKKAQQMHTEGKEYKNIIEGMHFLNDDLDNSTFKFYLALERYKINSGFIKQCVDDLEPLRMSSEFISLQDLYGSKVFH